MVVDFTVKELIYTESKDFNSTLRILAPSPRIFIHVLSLTATESCGQKSLIRRPDFSDVLNDSGIAVKRISSIKPSQWFTLLNN